MWSPSVREAEAARRLAAARAALGRDGLDALLVTGGTNLVYLSGYPRAERTLARPFFLVLPRSGPPCLVVHTGRRAEAARYSWVADVRTYERLSVAPVDELRAALRDRGVLHGRVGAELGFEQRLQLPYVEFERLRDGLAGVELADASELLWGLRQRKSSAELACLRQAGQLTAVAYASCFRQAHGGLTEAQIALNMRAEMLRLSGGDTSVILTSGAGNYDLATGIPGPRRVEQGDMVWMDAGCSVHGYWSDYSRAGVVGGPSAVQREAQELVHAATMAGVRLIRPGVPLAAIADACEQGLARSGLSITSSISGLAGRVGHGIGLDATEPPHVARAPPDQSQARRWPPTWSIVSSRRMHPISCGSPT